MSMHRPVPAPLQAQTSGSSAVYDAHDLIPDGIKAEIVLDGQTYTLRITRTGKLILTK